jgi:hypothetical protein
MEKRVEKLEGERTNLVFTVMDMVGQRLATTKYVFHRSEACSYCQQSRKCRQRPTSRVLHLLLHAQPNLRYR